MSGTLREVTSVGALSDAGPPQGAEAPSRGSAVREATSVGAVWCAKAWVDGRWQKDVLLEVNAEGFWSRITPNAPPPSDVELIQAPILAGIVNAHSHAFQRAFAGQAEHRQGEADDFWSWRQQMYGLALTLTPDALFHVARQLYTELLRGGYTQVCEFHYLHHQPDGEPYPGRLDMALALLHAAQDTGIGITLLPVLYERAGFAAPQLRDEQRRFATDVDSVLALRDGLRAEIARQNLRCANVGVAVHSLRAASAGSIAELARRVQDDQAPIHIHIAEQTGEVQDCLAATGQRPIAWLCAGLGEGVQIDARWQLVHATHALPDEMAAVARTGASLVLCPSTEANLGDGLTDLPRWLADGVPMAIGSDSHVTRDWREELRLAEYGQRLLHHKRNVLADPQRFGGSTAARLFEQALHAGGRAAGFEHWGIRVGARADLLVLDVPEELAGLPVAGTNGPDTTLDQLVFSSPGRAFSGVMVGGEWRWRST